MTITIDTSVFVEMMLAQERAKESKSLLEAIAEGKIAAVVSHFTLHAIEAMIPSPQKLSEFLKDVEHSKGLEVYDTTLSDERSVAILSGKIGLDFDDSIQFYVAKLTGSSAIVSFDRHFDSCGIARQEPSEILEVLNAKAENKRSGS
jgi:predicted nucleic acid-binding protein